VKKILFSIPILILILAFIFLTIPPRANAAACSFTSNPSTLKAGNLNSIKFNKNGIGGANLYALFTSNTGACTYNPDLPGKESQGCTSDFKVAQETNSITFYNDKLGDLKTLRAGTYTVKLCDDAGNGLCAPECESSGVIVQTSSGETPSPNPTGPGANTSCTIDLNSDDYKNCSDVPGYRARGSCTIGFYCDAVLNSCSVGICKALNCTDGSNNCYGVPENTDTTGIRCTYDTDCFSGSCVKGFCDTTLVAMACDEKVQYLPESGKFRHTGEFSCNTAIGTIDIDPEGFTQSILRLLLGLSGGILLILIIINGYKIMTSQGDPEKIKDAREGIIAAIAGILLIIFSLSILQLITVDIIGIPGFNK